MITFEEFPKIYRLSREMVITEKLDGTNASVIIDEEGNFATASRTQLITPDKDNYGFSKWAHEHKDELMTLGPGRHFGEWWGQGIQRKYGLTEKRFSLFNIRRWEKPENSLPSCVSLVPVLTKGVFDTETIKQTMEDLKLHGSAASPGFMNPEGVVIFHMQGNILLKKTFEKDDKGKDYGA